MNCVLNQQEQEELLLGYTCAQLDADTARIYERHLKSCPQCQQLVELQLMLNSTIQEWAAPDPSPNFDAKLFAQIRAEQVNATPWWQALFGWKLLVPAALAATLLIVFLVRKPEPTAVVEAIPTEQIEKVEQALEDFEALHAISEAPAKEAL